jgi:hypothetical protein
VIKVMHSEGAILGGKLDVVVVTCLADEFDESWPGRKDVSAESRLAGVEALAESVRAQLRLFPRGSLVEDFVRSGIARTHQAES